MFRFSAIITIFSFITFLSGCKSDKLPSGVDLKIVWAECSNSPKYENYVGKIFFIPINDFSSVNQSNWDSLKNGYTNAECNNGKAASFLIPGQYIAEPDTFLNYLSPDIIDINPDELLEKELKFIYCE